LPKVLSGSEVSALLEAVGNPKYRAVLMVMYSGGFRITEACQLRPEDIDSKRMLLHVRDGKGHRDRYTLLSKRVLEYLRHYWRQNRPQAWLFPGLKDGAVSPNAVRRTFQRARRQARITKPVTPHVLRHSFATHLLESGTDITIIQMLLGHASVRATTVYTHVSLEYLSRIRSPLDLLNTPDGEILG
jgi:site-specific recombinase XerD